MSTRGHRMWALRKAKTHPPQCMFSAWQCILPYGSMVGICIVSKTLDERPVATDGAGCIRVVRNISDRDKIVERGRLLESLNEHNLIG